MRTHNPSYVRSEYHTHLAKMSFDKIFDLTAGVYFNFYNIHAGVNVSGFFFPSFFFSIFRCAPSPYRGFGGVFPRFFFRAFRVSNIQKVIVFVFYCC